MGVIVSWGTIIDVILVMNGDGGKRDDISVLVIDVVLGG